MPKWVRLLDALENPNKYGDISQIPIDYVSYIQAEPRIRIIVTRNKKNKPISLEEKITPKYYATMFKGKVYLVCDEVTVRELTLNDEKTAAKKIKTDAENYGNASLKAKGVEWDEETVGILDTLPKSLRNIAGWYWTTIPCAKFDAKGRFICGLKLIFNGTVQGEDSFGILNYDGWPRLTSVPVRPLIELRRNTYVDLECMDGSPLPIKLK